MKLVDLRNGLTFIAIWFLVLGGADWIVGVLT